MKLFFCHIPKTSGTSLYTELSKTYPSFNVSTNLDLTEEKIETLNDFNFIISHVPLELALTKFNDRYKILFLRDPIDRIISQINHILTDPFYNNWFPSDIWDYLGSNLEKESFIKLFDNHQSKYASLLNWQLGVHLENSQSFQDFIPDITETVTRIKSLDYVGITEDPRCMHRLIGYHTYIEERKNVGLYRIKKNEIPLDILNNIIQRNSIDIEVYNIIKDWTLTKF